MYLDILTDWNNDKEALSGKVLAMNYLVIQYVCILKLCHEDRERERESGANTQVKLISSEIDLINEPLRKMAALHVIA